MSKEKTQSEEQKTLKKLEKSGWICINKKLLSPSFSWHDREDELLVLLIYEYGYKYIGVL